MSRIEWTDATWNPTRGCTRVSPGCEACYAERQAHRFSGAGGTYEGLTELGKQGPRWTGTIRLVPEHLDQPLRWRRPRRIFVDSMSDLFHDGVPDDFIDKVFLIMARAKRHTFQVLTKRPERMQAYVSEKVEARNTRWQWASQSTPLPNVWLGVSVENQETANERIPLLLRTPAAVRFLSVEPLLEHINLESAGAFPIIRTTVEPLGAHRWELQRAACEAARREGMPPVDWIIVGGESGPSARDCEISWISSIVLECGAAGIACFVKQLGRWPYSGSQLLDLSDRRKGADPKEWPWDLRVREFPR